MPEKNETVSHVLGNSRPSGQVKGNGSKKPRTDWKKTAQKFEEELGIAKLRYQELTQELAEVKLSAPSLAEREATKLRRFSYLIFQLRNAPLCDRCRSWLARHEEEIEYAQKM